jgi:hypothetical protein
VRFRSSQLAVVHVRCAKPCVSSSSGDLYTLNVQKGLVRLWLIGTIAWFAVLACYASCDGDIIKRYFVPLSFIFVASLFWAYRGFKAQ